MILRGVRMIVDTEPRASHGENAKNIIIIKAWDDERESGIQFSERKFNFLIILFFMSPVFNFHARHYTLFIGEIIWS